MSSLDILPPPALCAPVLKIERPAPVGTIVGGVVGGVLVVGVIIAAALCKTGRLKYHKRGSSSGQAGDNADGSAPSGTQYPVAGPAHGSTGTHYPVPGSAYKGTHYPSIVQYPQPV